jgi:hypothetical protein
MDFKRWISWANNRSALIPQPLLSLGESGFKVPLPRLGEGFRVRAGIHAGGLMDFKQVNLYRCTRSVLGVSEFLV